MAEEENNNAEGEGGKKGGSKMMLIIIVVVVLLLGGGGAAFFLMGGEEENPDEQAPEEETEELLTAKMAPLVVNLAGGSNFIKLTLMLEYDAKLLPPELADTIIDESHASDFKLPPELFARRPMMRDAAIAVIAAKTTKELLTPDGKESLKEELIEALNEATAFDDAAILNVYFIDFIVQ
ncbi:MAG: flagellar basal body-associated FliL family protein [Bdellovibrionales bacterium]|nr:flagellar basal body-associated FliL family protein [Bdellovibrionales bacterium]